MKNRPFRLLVVALALLAAGCAELTNDEIGPFLAKRGYPVWGTRQELYGDTWEVFAFDHLRPAGLSYCAADQREMSIRPGPLGREIVPVPGLFTTVAPLPCDKARPQDFLRTFGFVADENDYAAALAAALALTGKTGTLTAPIDWHDIDASLRGWHCLKAYCIVAGSYQMAGEFHFEFLGDVIENRDLDVTVFVENHAVSRLSVGTRTNHPEV